MIKGHVTTVLSFMICVDKNLLAMIHKWINTEGRCIHKGDWKDRYDVKVHWINQIYGFKNKNKNVFVIMGQNDGHHLFYKIMSLQTF